jgi:hypothetical protein
LAGLIAMLTLRKNPYADNSEGYLVYADGECIGRIYYSVATKHYQPWFWGLDHFSWQGCTKPQYGKADTKEAAMAAFRATWDSKTR